MKAARAGSGERTDLPGEILADARQLEQLLLVHAADRVGPCADGIGGRAIRADLEQILALNLEQVGDL